MRRKSRVLLWLFGLLVVAAAAARAEVSSDWLREQLAAAPAGSVIQVPAGVHQGPFVLERTVALVAEPGTVLRGDGKTHVVSVRAPSCRIEGFEITRSGLNLSEDHAALHITARGTVVRRNTIKDCLHGVYVRKADDCVIEENVILGSQEYLDVPNPVTAGLRASGEDLCTVTLDQNRRGNGIHLWNSAGHVIRGNRIEGTRDGIYFSFTDRTFVTGNRIHKVRYGLHYMYSDENRFEENRFSENAAGSALMFSTNIVLRRNHFVANRSHRAYGLLLQAMNETRIEDNVISGNTLGFYMENGNWNTVSGNHVIGNHVGLRVSDSSSQNHFFENTFVGNLHPLETTGNNLANEWASQGRGNYWDDAIRLDLNRDGIGDIAHHEPDLFGGYRRDFPAIGLLSGSPGERLVRFLHRRLHLPGIPSVTDPKPLAELTALHDRR